MEDFTVYVLDFEGSLKTGVLEYGLVGLTAKKGIFFSETKLCKNRENISASETACHGICAKELVNCEDFSCEIEKFVRLREKAFFCAHNAAFEDTLLSAYCPIVPNAYHIGFSQERRWFPWLDTLFLYKKYVKNQGCGLRELIEVCGLWNILQQLGEKFCPDGRKNFHNALFDSLACALLFLNFIRSDIFKGKSLAWLIEQSSPKEEAMDMKQLKML